MVWEGPDGRNRQPLPDRRSGPTREGTAPRSGAVPRAERGEVTRGVRAETRKLAGETANRRAHGRSAPVGYGATHRVEHARRPGAPAHALHFTATRRSSETEEQRLRGRAPPHRRARAQPAERGRPTRARRRARAVPARRPRAGSSPGDELVDVVRFVPAPKRCVMRACRAGRIAGASLVGRRWLAPRAAVEAWLRELGPSSSSRPRTTMATTSTTFVVVSRALESPCAAAVRPTLASPASPWSSGNDSGARAWSNTPSPMVRKPREVLEHAHDRARPARGQVPSIPPRKPLASCREAEPAMSTRKTPKAGPRSLGTRIRVARRPALPVLGWGRGPSQGNDLSRMPDGTNRSSAAGSGIA